MTSIFDQGLAPVDANYAVQSPVDFIERTATVYPEYPAVIHGAIRYTWAQTYERCRRLASALKGRGIGRGDTVAVMLPNIPAMVESHFGVPMIGAVLNTLNVRLDAEAIAFMLEHGEAKVVIADREFGEVIKDAVSRLDTKPLVIDVDDPEYGEGVQVSDLDYEAFLQEGDPAFQWSFPENEWDAISLNYTSGTTGNPKGVVYHHRGAYINAIGNQAVWSMDMHPVYLWTLPMFHCNGWCFPWTITAMAGTHVCLRRVDPEKILQLIRDHQVTHMCGAPIVLNALLNVPESAKAGIDHEVKSMTARPGDWCHRRDGYPGNPRLWPDRSVWAGDGLRVEVRVGCAAAARPGPQEGSPGRSLSHPGWHHGWRPEHHGAGAQRRQDHR